MLTFLLAFWLACLEMQLDTFLLLLGRRVSKVICRAFTVLLLDVVLLSLKSKLYIEEQCAMFISD